MSLEPQPTELRLDSPDRLRIVWSDGTTRCYTARELRDNCPCASCIEKRRASTPSNPLEILHAEEAQPLSIVGMVPTGRYAYAIHFSDRHDTGIYTLESLRELGEVLDK